MSLPLSHLHTHTLSVSLSAALTLADILFIALTIFLSLPTFFLSQIPFHKMHFELCHKARFNFLPDWHHGLFIALPAVQNKGKYRMRIVQTQTSPSAMDSVSDDYTFKKNKQIKT